jgi:hypothetical protein
MSTFKVKLTQGDQGNLDTNGVSTGTSVQRTVYVMGPHKTNRKLVDGATFTDSNYWKRFAFPQVTCEQAFIEVVTDDGSVYVDGDPANLSSNGGTYPVVYNFTLPTVTTYAVNTAAGRLADVLTDTGSNAVYTQISASTNACKCKVNGSAIFDVSTSVVQVFNPGDLDITKLEFQNDTGGNSVVQVLMSVRVKSNS